MNTLFIDAYGNKHNHESCDPIEWRISAYGLVMNNNKILTVKPSWKDVYELPWWWVEIYENISQGLKREFLEETWYIVTHISESPFFIYESNFCYINNNQKQFCHSLCLFFLCEISHKYEHTDTHIANIDWINIENITQNNTLSHHFMAIQKFLQK